MTYSGSTPCLRQDRTRQGEPHYVRSPQSKPAFPHRRFATSTGSDESFCGCCGNEITGTEGHPVVAAWGANARLLRVNRVRALVPDVDWRCLGTTKDGHPRHPLYVKGDQPLVRF